MSQWRKYLSKALNDVKKDTLKKACKDMGVDFDETVKSINRQQVDAVLTKDGKQLSIGFIFNKDNNGKVKLELEGDFWRSGLSEEHFLDLLAQNYQKHNIIQQVTEQGWFIDKNEIDTEGNVVLEAVQW